AARHGAWREARGLDDQRIRLRPADGVTRRGRRPGTRVRPSVQVEMPHAAALAGEDDFILLLDEVHASGIRVHQQPTVTAAAATSAAWLRDDDVGDARRVGPGRLRPGRTAAAAAAATATPVAGGHTGQQLRGRYRCPEPVEASRAVRIDSNPMDLEA